MKRMMPAIMTTLTTLSLGATLFAESPTWAEQLHKTKTGIWPAGVEKRLEKEKMAREQARQQQAVAEAIAKLDANGDGVVSKAERESLPKLAESVTAGAQQ